MDVSKNISKSDSKGSVSNTVTPEVTESVGTLAVPAGLFIDCTLLNVDVILFAPPNILGYTAVSQGDIVALVLGGITAVWSLGILFMLSPNLFTTFKADTVEIQL